MTAQSPGQSRPTLILYTVHFHKSEWEQANRLGLDLYDNLTRPISNPLAFGASIPIFCAVEPDKVDTDAAATVIVIPVLGKMSSSSKREDSIARMKQWHEKLGPGHVLPVLLADVWRASEGLLPGKPLLTELYGEEPRRRSTITDIVVEVAKLLAGDGQRPILFVSHAKSDLASTKQAAAKIASYAKSDSTATAFFDRTELFAGDSTDKQIDFAVSRGVFVAVRGDSYSSRIWCQREFLGAKRHGLPTLTVETLQQGERRSLAYGGNNPTLVWNENHNDPGEVVSRAMIEWLRAIHFRREGNRVRSEAKLPEAVILSRPPELLDMAQGLLRSAAPELVMHPDPELSTQELNVLRGVNPRLHLVTPLTAYRRVLSRESNTPGDAPLEGIQVAMSLSDSPDVDGPEGYKMHHVIDVTVQLARTLISSGAAIAYGGDFRQRDMNNPKRYGYTILLSELIGAYNQTAARPADFLHSYLAATIPSGDVPDNAPMTLHHLVDSPDVAPLAKMPPPDGKAHPLALYFSDMRQVMAKKTAACIIIGGKAEPRLKDKGDGFGGIYPGVVEEAWRSLELERPVYVVGGFGGAAAIVAELLEDGPSPSRLQDATWSKSAYYTGVVKKIKSDPFLKKLGLPPSMAAMAKAIKAAGSPRLKSNSTSIAWNGLTKEENKTLFWSRDPVLITSLLMRGLLNVTRKATSDKLAIELVHGSVTDARELDAIAVATFDDVPLGGAGKALDSAVGGRAKVGRAEGQEIISVSETGIGADWIYLASLGQLRDTGSLEEKIQAAAVQTAIAARRQGLRRLGVVAYGGAVISDVPAVANAMLAGLKDLAGFASITWFESNEDRFEALRRILISKRLVKLTTRRAMAPVIAAEPQEQPLILQVSYVDEKLDVTVLPPTGTAIAAFSRQVLSAADVSSLAAGSGPGNRETPDMATLTSRGQKLAKLLLGDEAKEILARVSEAKIMIVHDLAASRIPFETLNASVPAAARSGMNRRLAVAGVPVDHLFARSPKPKGLNVLLVINPTADLKGAAEEGAAIEAVLKQQKDRISLTVLSEGKATKAALLEAFPKTDVLHYCGHAFFDGPGEGDSGLILAGDNALTLADLRGVTTPRVAFVNACEAGRVRGKFTTEAASFAEFFLRSGVEAYLGTFWTVNDAAAQLFAVEVYTRLATGKTLDEAVILARKKLFDDKYPDWANYILYGDGRFRLVREGS
jgi:CHAT domain-containing protein